MKKVLTLICFLSLASLAFAEKADSVGTKVKNGKVYILHKVEKGDGMYGISKRYGVKLADLIAENPGSESVIKIDQLIWIPTEQEVVMEEPVVEDFFERTEEYPKASQDTATADTTATTYAVYHTVSRGENLFGIARTYGTTVQAIKNLNGLESDMLAIGQKLMVPSNKSDEGVVQEDVIIDVEESGFEIPVEVIPEDEIPELAEEIVEVNNDIVIEGYSIKVVRNEEYDLEKVEETGQYLAAGDDIPHNKNFAYHFNAPINTIIMVTNPKTNKTVFVKIIGNYERAKDSAAIIILSELSASSIGLQDSGESVNLSYAR